MDLGRLEPEFAYVWIFAVVMASGATLWLRVRRPKVSEDAWISRSAARFLTLALVLPVATLTAALVCFQVFEAEPLRQYNDDTTMPYHRLWGSLWFLFLSGIPLMTFFALRACLLGVRPPRLRIVVPSILVVSAGTVSWFAAMENFPSV